MTFVGVGLTSKTVSC